MEWNETRLADKNYWENWNWLENWKIGIDRKIYWKLEMSSMYFHENWNKIWILRSIWKHWWEITIFFETVTCCFEMSKFVEVLDFLDTSNFIEIPNSKFEISLKFLRRVASLLGCIYDAGIQFICTIMLQLADFEFDYKPSFSKIKLKPVVCICSKICFGVAFLLLNKVKNIPNQTFRIKKIFEKKTFCLMFNYDC